MSRSMSGNRSRRGTVLLVALFAPVLAFLSSSPSSGQAATSEATAVALQKAVPLVFAGDVRDLPNVAAPQLRPGLEHKAPPIRLPPATVGIAAPNIPLAQMPPPTHSFDGLSFNSSVTGGQAGAGWPPDVNGDVGPSHYIEAVNDAYAIYSKSGTLLAAFTENALWNGAGTSPCNGKAVGDPVVLHDAVADRWILTNLAFAFSGGTPVSPFYECIAVSRTSDPVGGGWWLYALRMDTGAAGQPAVGTLNDYPKFGIWTDCLYMSANGFSFPGGAFTGTMFASFSRSDMYAGAALTSALGFISNSADPFTMIPSTLLGTSTGSLPPAGTPNYFVSQSQGSYAFEVRKFTAGTNCGGGGLLSAPTNVSETSYNVVEGAVVPQPNTGTALDTLGFRLMQKVPYRRIGSVESLWVTHSVLSGAPGSTVVPQWAQLDVTGGTIAGTPAQQQIYAPDSSLHRWMPSLAVDGQGNMAIGYSTSNGTSPNFPSIAYSGRLAGDPLNNLSQTERQVIAGSGSQIGISRWGDYTAMSIDPADDCTFWYIDEYYSSQANGNSGNWQTHIGSFKFPGCGYATAAAKFYTVTPCRLLDTRTGSPLTAGITYEVAVAGFCGIAATATSASVNVTEVNATLSGFMAFWPAQGANPGTSTINFAAGRVLANNAIFSLAPGLSGSPGAIWLTFSSGSATADLLIDVNGYFQ
jgi:hypothetical protein